MVRRSVVTVAFVAALVVATMTGCVTAQPLRDSGQVSPDPANVLPAADESFGALEARFDARLGVYALDTGSGRAIEYRSDERFAYASTIKAFAVAVLLQRTTEDELNEVVPIEASDLLDYAPITKQRVGVGMSLRELSDAAIRYSDNTAANLIFDRIGGPTGLDLELEAIGDDVTQVDREEPELNEASPGDARDTSTPRALATDLKHFLLDDPLDEDDRETLTAWLVNNTTGDELIRAGVPEGWVVGDKTGAAGYGTRNDIAVVWPRDSAPIVMAVMSTRSSPDATYDDALIAEAAAIAIGQLLL